MKQLEKAYIWRANCSRNCKYWVKFFHREWKKS